VTETTYFVKLSRSITVKFVEENPVVISIHILPRSKRVAGWPRQLDCLGAKAQEGDFVIRSRAIDDPSVLADSAQRLQPQSSIMLRNKYSPLLLRRNPGKPVAGASRQKHSETFFNRTTNAATSLSALPFQF
jgi:hypothetical protein